MLLTRTGHKSNIKALIETGRGMGPMTPGQPPDPTNLGMVPTPARPGFRQTKCRKTRTKTDERFAEPPGSLPADGGNLVVPWSAADRHRATRTSKSSMSCPACFVRGSDFMSELFDQAQASAATSEANNPPAASIRHRDGILEVPGELQLHLGGSLPRVHIAWRMSGPEVGPVVVALGGISADRRVVTVSPQEPGWWQGVAGVGKALPAERCRILSFDYLGGSGETTGPVGASPFPAISSYDQADILLRLLNHLGIKTLHALFGASYGGMVGLTFAEKYPERLARLCVISAADRSNPMATAWRSVQRGIVRFAQQHGDAAGGLKLARALGMATYRSQEEFAARFSASPQRDGDRHVFAVEKYLFSRGEEFVQRHRPEAFLALSESIDLHRVDATRIFVPTSAIAIAEDQLVPLADVRAMVARLPNAQLIELSSVYGHDAFLKENAQLKPLFAGLLEPSR